MSFYEEPKTDEGHGLVLGGGEEQLVPVPGVPGIDGCVSPPPPPPVFVDGNQLVLGREEVAETDLALWDMLQHEGYRQRGEGFRSDWAFHRMADDEDLGYPLAKSARLTSSGKEYAYQVYARDTLFCEVPNWSSVQRLSDLAGGKMPSSGLAFDLLAATYQAVGQQLQPGWLSHRVALQERLGPAMSAAYRLTVDAKEYAIQVFACDLIYFVPGDWQKPLRLSALAGATDPGQVRLREALWAATAKATGLTYQGADLFYQAARKASAGTPLCNMYYVDFGGVPYAVQVFALDTVYGRASGGDKLLQSGLRTKRQPTPEVQIAAVIEPEAAAQPGGTIPADALSTKRPVFGILPLPGQPGISQFYGYTRFAAGEGRQYYGATQGMHSGIDFWVPVGTPLIAINHGVVLFAGTGGPFGAAIPQSLVVRYGNIYALYGHASEVQVTAGQAVTPGQVIGLSGDFGGGPHLHFELRPVPDGMLGNSDPNQDAVNPGFALNPLEYFSPDLRGYFERQLRTLGGVGEHFCTGSFDQQPRIVFGQAVLESPCT